MHIKANPYRVSKNSLCRPFAMLILAIGIAGCQSLKNRSDETTPTPSTLPTSSTSGGPADHGSSQPPESGTETKISGEKIDEPVIVTPRAPKRVGVILSGGGVRAFAHVGVLKGFLESKIPVSSVVGLEWGALPGLFFSTLGQAHEAEWKMLRLADTDLPEKGFFSKVSNQKISRLDSYLDTTVKRTQVQDGKVAFACPAYSLSRDKVVWFKSGLSKDVLKSCLPYPPLFQPASDYVAEPSRIAEAAKYLRDGGADFIILVDILSNLRPLDAKAPEFSETLLWHEAQYQTAVRAHTGIDFVIHVPLPKVGLADFKQRRELILEGQRNSKKALSQLTSKYQF